MSLLEISKQTILKYDTPGPRYTSYPTAPEWTSDVNADVYREKLTAFGQSDKTLSMYIHVPFCQSMCYYCGCNVVIRKQEDRYGDEYLEYLSREIDLVRSAIGRRAVIKQFHWGGGTPTFLNEDQIARLFKKVTDNFEVDFNGEIAIEIDPRTIDKPKIRRLRDLGFNRVSMGVQDFDAIVQKQVNRWQPREIVEEFYNWCRQLKFSSVNFDLIYGLPGQKFETFTKTIQDVVRFKPDRVALYSFAYVPWLKKHQTKLEQKNFPTTDEKLDLFLEARRQFLSGGYTAIAMDHFALKDDELARAFAQGSLYRNFMGYTVKPADEYVGLGLTSIGFLENTFIQNHKTIKEYYAPLREGKLPVERGKKMTRDDQIRQWVISSLMCRFKVDKAEFHEKFGENFDEYFAFEQAHITRCQMEGLINRDDSPRISLIEVTELGKLFIRNVCMGFDWYLRQPKAHKQFSRTV